MLGFFFLIIGSCKEKSKLDNIKKIEKYTEESLIFPAPQSEIEKEYQKIINLLQQETIKIKASAENDYKDMIEYYTFWAHQIKTPVASMKISLQNEDSEFSRKLRGDLFHIEQYIDMVLAFLRLGSEYTDYVFKKHSVGNIICASVKKFAGEFILRKLTLEYSSLDIEIITDEKWLSFVLQQIISNSLKYTKKGSISIYWEEPHSLCIKDTGIGISADELPRVFEKGYTGINGRIDNSASGLGLYLCRRICDNLGIIIKIDSIIGKGTEIKLIFNDKSITKM